MMIRPNKESYCTRIEGATGEVYLHDFNYVDYIDQLEAYTDTLEKRCSEFWDEIERLEKDYEKLEKGFDKACNQLARLDRMISGFCSFDGARNLEEWKEEFMKDD